MCWTWYYHRGMATTDVLLIPVSVTERMTHIEFEDVRAQFKHLGNCSDALTVL